MNIVGLKFTHDGGLAILRNGRLEISVEMEKLANAKRHAALTDTAEALAIIESTGLSIMDVDVFCVDGWIGLDAASVPVTSSGRSVRLPVAPYREQKTFQELLNPLAFRSDLKIGGRKLSYHSYSHMAGHIAAAYCTSPFATAGQSANVLVWDGGTHPRLYFVDPIARKVTSLGPIMMMMGDCYATFAHYFEPFLREKTQPKADLSTAGKLMAYIALGETDVRIVNAIRELYDATVQPDQAFADRFGAAFQAIAHERGYKSNDVLASLHGFIEELLITSVHRKYAGMPGSRSENLCYVGGCALNIKWNSRLRNSGPWKRVWIPPFANDAGSAIGAACCEHLRAGSTPGISWSVYSGPKLKACDPVDGWSSCPAEPAKVAEVLATKGPVVFLSGSADLGPRALGNRSILADPRRPEMKEFLNKIKRREAYRPVAPICLTHHAQAVFEPGCADPYMLYDHIVRDSWKERIPAVLHLDGTARLQTVTHEENLIVATILEEFHRLTGVPLLCNTSANLCGSGFFPDARSACLWAGTDHVWADGILYSKVD